MIKNSLWAYFIWRFSHILAILFRAEDKIGSDISLLMPLSIWRLTVSPSYPSSSPPSLPDTPPFLPSDGTTPSLSLRRAKLSFSPAVCLLSSSLVLPPSFASFSLSGIFPHFPLSSSLPISRLPIFTLFLNTFASPLRSQASFYSLLSPPPASSSQPPPSVTSSTQTLLSLFFLHLTWSLYPSLHPPIPPSSGHYI